MEITAYFAESKSITKLVEDMHGAVTAKAGITPNAPNQWAYVEELFDDVVVYAVNIGEAKTYYRAPYLVGDDGRITIGSPQTVEKITTYPPMTAAESARFGESKTIKSMVQRFLKSARSVSDHENVPKAVKKQIEALRKLLHKTYEDITSDEPSSGTVPATEATRGGSGFIPFDEAGADVEFCEDGVLIGAEEATP